MTNAEHRYTGWVMNQIPVLGDVLMERIGYKSNGYFVEVGAFDCRQWSPCYPLAQMGWSGVFIEPQPDLVKKCRERFSGRDDVTILQKAISNFLGKTELHLGGSLSTIDNNAKSVYTSMPEFRVTGLCDDIDIEVEVSTLDEELGNIGAPVGFDVLSIDVEGSEIAVLGGFSIRKWMPKIVLVETHAKHPEPRLRAKSIVICEYFASAGYSEIYSDHINSIFARGNG